MGMVFTTGGMEGNKDAYGRGIMSDHNRGKISSAYKQPSMSEWV